MTRPQAAGVMLIALGLIYALLYAAWLRKRRRHESAAVAVRGPSAEPRESQESRRESRESRDSRRETGPGAARHGSGPEDVGILRAEGTYISTTTAASRHERVAVAGLGNRSRATMVVRRGEPDELVRFERQGEPDVVVTRGRLVDVRRDRGMAGKFMGANRLLVLRWRADDGAIYETGFLPRYRADLERLETALWWHHDGAAIDTRPEHREGEPTT